MIKKRERKRSSRNSSSWNNTDEQRFACSITLLPVTAQEFFTPTLTDGSWTDSCRTYIQWYVRKQPECHSRRGKNTKYRRKKGRKHKWYRYHQVRAARLPIVNCSGGVAIVLSTVPDGDANHSGSPLPLSLSTPFLFITCFAGCIWFWYHLGASWLWCRFDSCPCIVSLSHVN